MRLSCDQRSNALSIWFSAAETSPDNVFVRRLSTWPGATPPFQQLRAWVTDCLNPAPHRARLQLRDKGGVEQTVPASSATTAMATRPSNCWRRVMFMGDDSFQ